MTNRIQEKIDYLQDALNGLNSEEIARAITNKDIKLAIDVKEHIGYQIQATVQTQRNEDRERICFELS